MAMHLANIESVMIDICKNLEELNKSLKKMEEKKNECSKN